MLNLHSYEDFYKIHINTIDEHRTKFEHYSDIIDSAIEECEANGPPVHVFDKISPETEQAEAEMIQEGMQ